jgi:hypothetical protein
MQRLVAAVSWAIITIVGRSGLGWLWIGLVAPFDQDNPRNHNPEADLGHDSAETLKIKAKVKGAHSTTKPLNLAGCSRYASLCTVYQCRQESFLL